MKYDIFDNVDGDYFHVIVGGRIAIDAYGMEFGDGRIANYIFPSTYFKHLVVVPIE